MATRTPSKMVYALGIAVGVVVILLQLFAVLQVVQGQVDRAHARDDSARTRQVAAAQCPRSDCAGQGRVGRPTVQAMDLMTGRGVDAAVPMLASYQP